MLVAAAAKPQTGWIVLCSCGEVKFAVTIFTVVRRSRAAQSLNDSLELHIACLGHE